MPRFLLCDDAHPAETAPLCKRYGFGIEMQAFHDPGLLQREPGAIEDHLLLAGEIQLRAIHGCYGDLCPGSFDPMVRGVARSRFDLSYDVARRLDASHLVLHHGYVPHTSPPDRWLRRCAAFWREFLSGKGDGIRIHVENMLELDPGLLSDLIDTIDSPIVDANLDIGHVHCNSRVDNEGWIKRLGKRIRYVHLHDNHGEEDEHLSFGHGSLPLKEVLSMLAEISPDALWGIEVNVEAMEESVAWLKDNGFTA